MNIYVYFQSHDLFNGNVTYLDNSIGHFIKICMDSHLQHHELEEIPKSICSKTLSHKIYD